jgi:hypothetical protein
VLVNKSYKLSSNEISSGLSGEDGNMELMDIEGLKSGLEVF